MRIFEEIEERFPKNGVPMVHFALTMTEIGVPSYRLARNSFRRQSSGIT